MTINLIIIISLKYCVFSHLFSFVYLEELSSIFYCFRRKGRKHCMGVQESECGIVFQFDMLMYNGTVTTFKHFNFFGTGRGLQNQYFFFLHFVISDPSLYTPPHPTPTFCTLHLYRIHVLVTCGMHSKNYIAWVLMTPVLCMLENALHLQRMRHRQ